MGKSRTGSRLAVVRVYVEIVDYVIFNVAIIHQFLLFTGNGEQKKNLISCRFLSVVKILTNDNNCTSWIWGNVCYFNKENWKIIGGRSGCLSNCWSKRFVDIHSKWINRDSVVQKQAKPKKLSEEESCVRPVGNPWTDTRTKHVICNLYRFYIFFQLYNCQPELYVPV